MASVGKKKAKFIAEKLGISCFKVSSGWLDKLKKNNSIKYHKVCGESADAREGVYDEWKIQLDFLIKSKNVFNADETRLFYRCVSDSWI